MNEAEKKAYESLTQAWKKVYVARETLGQEHEDYKELDEITGLINSIACRLEKKKPQ